MGAPRCCAACCCTCEQGFVVGETIQTYAGVPDMDLTSARHEAATQCLEATRTWCAMFMDVLGWSPHYQQLPVQSTDDMLVVGTLFTSAGSMRRSTDASLSTCVGRDVTQRTCAMGSWPADLWSS
eukprot:6457355-Amphidinium_carterae.1